MGEIQSAEDALEFIMNGAAVVAAETANFRNPYALPGIVEGLEKYIEESDIKDLRWIMGIVI